MRTFSVLGLLVTSVVFAQACKSTGVKEESAGMNWPVYRVMVEEGDTLASIAAKYDTAWQEIARLNRVEDPTSVDVGTILRVVPGRAGLVAGYGPKGQPKSGLLFSPPSRTGSQSSKLQRGLLFAPSASDRFAKGDLYWPVTGDISSYYGKRWGRMHKGIDIRAPRGTEILSPAPGTVEFSGRKRGYGKTIIIRHEGYKTLYAHCNELFAKKGAFVTPKQLIAHVGRSGNATGSHLHFEIRDMRGRPEDPLPWLRTRNFMSQILRTPTDAAEPMHRAEVVKFAGETPLEIVGNLFGSVLADFPYPSL